MYDKVQSCKDDDALIELMSNCCVFFEWMTCSELRSNRSWEVLIYHIPLYVLLIDSVNLSSCGIFNVNSEYLNSLNNKSHYNAKNAVWRY